MTSRGTPALHRGCSESVTFFRLWNRALNALVRLTDAIAGWRARSRQRQMLLAMDTYQLKDIGISRAEAHKEADKPFWRD